MKMTIDNTEHIEEIKDLARFDALNNNCDHTLYRDNEEYKIAFDDMSTKLWTQFWRPAIAAKSEPEEESRPCEECSEDVQINEYCGDGGDFLCPDCYSAKSEPKEEECICPDEDMDGTSFTGSCSVCEKWEQERDEDLHHEPDTKDCSHLTYRGIIQEIDRLNQLAMDRHLEGKDFNPAYLHALQAERIKRLNVVGIPPARFS